MKYFPSMSQQLTIVSNAKGETKKIDVVIVVVIMVTSLVYVCMYVLVISRTTDF